MKLALALLACLPIYAQAPARLDVDATDAPRRLFHVHMTLPVKPGSLTLLYPQWIPGEHMPSGPITNLVGLKIQAGKQAISWRRDDVNMFAFHVEVPAEATTLEISFDSISPPEASGFTDGASATTELAVMNWNHFLLYPQGADADSIQFQASLRVPNGWKYGTALPIRRESSNTIEFQPAPLTTLIDSPVSAGSHYRTIDLGTDQGAAHYLHLAGDSAQAIDIPKDLEAGFKNLVSETGALFGSRHYRNYHFLLTMSDHVAHFGLEHHESSDDRVDERSLIDASPRMQWAFLLPHEFTHSWNGKFRRPAGLVNGKQDGGYETPMKGDLLWVYEGLTEYLGEILTPRSGLWTPEEYRESLAITAASLDTEYGRTWRPLEDTAVAAQLLYSAGDDYGAYRRSVDYYPEGTLIWLEADTTIRQLSHNTKSLNDFCRTFHGGPGGAPAMKPYTFEDVVAGLNAVQPYDWAAFLHQRIRSTDAHAPLGGIQKAGWRLAYDAVRSDFWKSHEDYYKGADLSYSIGLKVKEDGSISDVALDYPAAKAGIAPSTKLIAVNGRQFTTTVLRETLQAGKGSDAPLEFLIKSGEYYKTYRVDYHAGERYPHLVRDESTPDLLTQIIAPLAKH